jgi:hypothetical protein
LHEKGNVIAMNRIFVGLIAVAIALFAAVPAQAVSVPGCFGGEFLLFGQSVLQFELGATDMTGDVILLNPTGTVKVGASNRIRGTIFANSIFIGTGAVVDKCVANSVTGPGTCTDTTQVGPGNFAPPAACNFPPVAVPVFPAVCSATNIIINAPGGTLAPGCYNKVTVEKDATLTLQAGQTVQVKQEFRQKLGSTVISDTTGSPATVVVKGAYITEAAVNITDVNITSLHVGANNVHIGNGSIVTNSLIFSPNGEIHLHTGSRLVGDTELVAVQVQLQPFTNEPPPPGAVCVCPAAFPNFAIENVPPDQWTAPTALARSCVQ